MNDSSFARALKHISEIIRHPHLHTAEILILACLVVLIVFIIIVSYALFQTRIAKSQIKTKTKRPRSDRLEEKSKAIRLRYAAIVVFLILSIASVAAMVHFDSNPGFCMGCHEMKQAFERSAKSAHSGADCVSCHQGPGRLGSFMQKLEYVEMIVERYKIAGKVSATPVSNQACLRCHKKTIDRTIVAGAIRVEHVHSQEAGYKCTDCHFEKGLFHADMKKLVESKMSRCTNCHDGKKAPAVCRTCHVRKAIGSAHVDYSKYAKVEASDTTACRTCHDVKKCLGCHEIRLPHQKAWVDGGHAYNAFIGKAICFECHIEENCLMCHEKLNAHGKDWRKKHGAKSKNQGEICARCHQYERFCMLCHDE